MNRDNRRIIFTADSQFAVNKTDGKRTLSGYALVWNALSSDRGGYKVRLMPNSATFASPTLALYHHDFRDVIGNSENGTLRYAPDNHGVKVEIDLPDTQMGRDTLELVEKGYVKGMSFAMVSAPDGKAVRENGEEIFQAEKYIVDEVSITPIPAFTQAQIGVKGEFAARNAQSILLQKYRLNLFRLPGPGSPAKPVRQGAV